MPIFEITHETIREISRTSFSVAGIKERDDLQRLLRDQIEVISPKTLVISEEFEEWDGSKRRIDLLGIDREANLVVIELKRTEDGGHMELQAIRYAAMISAMTFERAVEIYAAHLRQPEDDARTSILKFLDWPAPKEGEFAQNVRIVLASAEFSKELTTAVMWLNNQGLDIQCVRMQPYNDNGRLLVDVQRVIPLPEAADYQVQVRAKEQKERQEKAESYVIKNFWQGLLDRAALQTQLHANISPSQSQWIAAGSGIGGIVFSYVIGQDKGRVELYIGRASKEENKKIFDWLWTHKDEIEKAFDRELSWERLDENKACRIAFTMPGGGWKSDESKWPDLQDIMIDGMIKLEKALKPQLTAWKAELAKEQS